MGERKGTNKYYPPDYNPDKGSLNQYHGTHALRERARKLHLGILIIRFEMPYNIWCDGCGNHIGMGVRYNAEKTKVGMYYTTPIYQFRMKCHLCNNHFEIKTDPQNLDYVIVSGARRQERRWDPSENEQVAPEDKELTKKMAMDSMFNLEHNVDDVGKAKAAAPMLAKLEDLQLRWQDDFAANQLLRKNFRNRKKELKQKDDSNKALLSKSSLNIQLVDENPQDIRLAKLLKFSTLGNIEEKQKERRMNIERRSWFTSPKGPNVSNASTTLKSNDKMSLASLVVKPNNKSSLKVIEATESVSTSDKNKACSEPKVVHSLVSQDYGESDSN